MSSPAATCVYHDAEELRDAAAERIAEIGERALSGRGRFRWVMTGGSTIEPVYERLAAPPLRDRLRWDRVEVFFTDERCVPPDHPDSNFGMASRSLLDRVPIPCERIHRMRGEDPNPERAAIEHEHRLREALGIGRGEAPDFDLVLLGMGADAHVASLFPGDPQGLLEDRLVVAVEHRGDPAPAVDRLSMTAPALSAGRATLFVVGGEHKASAVHAALEGPDEPALVPARRVAPPEPPLWLLDRAAASGLSR
ncbi:MAG TPA: 6-phosphogluconolactonase [Gemmatimonadota bacterium]|nr:6-phosphogluconolactonase [Gemmatimonadota bacterium]